MRVGTKNAWPSVGPGLRRAMVIGAGLAVLLVAGRATAKSPVPVEVERLVAAVVKETAADCPVASPGDQGALDRCREALRRSVLRTSLAPAFLWGPPNLEGKRLRDAGLTALAPEVWTGRYAPLFMFTGDHEIDFAGTERLYRARVPVLFRNALEPGQYADPFWHDAEKWNAYQKANQITFWIDPVKVEIVAGQYSPYGHRRLAVTPRTPPAFAGTWMRIDAGTRPPEPALFAGLLHAGNPYRGRIESTYRNLAAVLRKGTCSECHAPDDRDRVARLALSPTPALAAGEMAGIMRAVRSAGDDAGSESGLDAVTRTALLAYGAEFEALIAAARDWEDTRR